MDFSENAAMFSDDEKDKKLLNKRQAPKAKPKTTDQEKDAPKSSAIHGSSFKDFQLKPELLKAIGEAGFEHPSEGHLNSTTGRHTLHLIRRRFALSSQKWNGKNRSFRFGSFAHSEDSRRTFPSFSFVPHKRTRFPDF